MRTIASSSITYSSAAEVTGPGTQTRVVEAAAPDIMEARVAAILAAVSVTSPGGWVLSHIDLAGGGDGHTFVCTMEFATSALLAVSPQGLEVDADEPLPVIMFYMAAQSEALTAARNALRPRIAALFSAPISASTVEIRQTLEAGAAKGTRFMGGLLLEIAPIPPPPP